MIKTLRDFEVTQKRNANGNRITTIKDTKNGIKIKIQNFKIKDKKILAINYLQEKKIKILFKFDNDNKLNLLSNNLLTTIKWEEMEKMEILKILDDNKVQVLINNKKYIRTCKKAINDTEYIIVNKKEYKI